MNVTDVTRSYTQYDGSSSLVVELAVERQADCLCQQTCVFVACSICNDGDVATGDHLGWVTVICEKMLAVKMRLDLRVVVDLDFREEGKLVGRETKADVAVAVS